MSAEHVHARTRLLLHPVVLVALATWLLNDHVLKQAFPCALTWILSDIAGLVAFPCVLVGLLPARGLARLGVPRAVLASSIATAVVFAAINVYEDASRLIGPLLSLLPRLVAGAALRTPGSAHVADAADLVALPFALVPALLAYRMHARSGGLVLVCVLVVFLAPGNARADHTPSIEVAGVVGGATAWDEPYRGHATYTLSGARVRLANATPHARMSVYGMFLRGHLSSVTPSYQAFGVTRARRDGFALGGSLGCAYPYFMLDVGLVASRVRTERASLMDTRHPIMAFARLAIGPREIASGTLQIGSTDGFFSDARIFDMGLYFERYAFTVRVAAGLGFLLLPDIASTDSFYEGVAPRARRPERRFDVVLDLELGVRIAQRLAGTFQFQTGTQLPRASLGLRVDLR